MDDYKSNGEPLLSQVLVSTTTRHGHRALACMRALRVISGNEWSLEILMLFGRSYGIFITYRSLAMNKLMQYMAIKARNPYKARPTSLRR